MSRTLLTHLRKSYLIVRAITAGSAYQVEHSCKLFADWCGGDIALCPPLEQPSDDHLTEEKLSAWLRSLEGKYSPRTINKMRGDVLSVWQDAADADHCREPKRRRVRVVKCAEYDPEIWEPEEIALLVAAAKSLKGFVVIDGVEIPRAEYFENILLVAWYTARRTGDCWRIHVDQLRGDRLSQSQNKTGVMLVSGLPEWLTKRLLSYGIQHPLKWPHWGRAFYYWMEKIRRSAGIVTTGAIQKIRRSTATDMEIHSPGSATKLLGHTSPKADVWYVKKSRVMQPIRQRDLPSAG